MDQGIAALLGASVGVAGTVLASAITGWSTRQQVRAQARAEHARWRRQMRREAYSAFLAPANESRNALKMAGRAFVGKRRDAVEIDRRLQQAHDQLALAQAAWANVAVEGPEPVEHAARSVYTTLRSTQTTLLALRDSPENTDRNAGLLERHAVEVGQLSERIGEFATAARTALDEIDG